MTLADDHTDDDVIIVTEEDIVSTPSDAENERLAADDPSASTGSARLGEDNDPDDEDDLDTDDSLAPTVGSSAAEDLDGEDDEDDLDTDDGLAAAAAGGAADDPASEDDEEDEDGGDADAEDDGLAAEHSGIVDDSPDDDADEDEDEAAIALAMSADSALATDAEPVVTAGTSPISLGGPAEVPDANPPAAGQAAGGSQTANGQPSDAADAAQSEANWPEIQSLFVDDPRRAVEQAAQVAGAALTALSTAARNREQSLRDGWQSGQPGTEDLRTTLQDYRELARRLSTLAAEL